MTRSRTNTSDRPFLTAPFVFLSFLSIYLAGGGFVPFNDSIPLIYLPPTILEPPAKGAPHDGQYHVAPRILWPHFAQRMSGHQVVAAPAGGAAPRTERARQPRVPCGWARATGSRWRSRSAGERSVCSAATSFSRRPSA